MARYLLDTTVFIDHAFGVHGASELIERLFGETGDIFTCDAVVAEVLSSGSDADIVIIEHLVRSLEYVSTSPDAAKHAGVLRRRLGRTSPRRLGDALIAGVAWSLEATVVTRNPKDFAGHGIPVLAYGQPPAA
jgi:predicted nucleic acid-binding protein